MAFRRGGVDTLDLKLKSLSGERPRALPGRRSPRPPDSVLLSTHRRVLARRGEAAAGGQCRAAGGIAQGRQL